MIWIRDANQSKKSVWSRPAKMWMCAYIQYKKAQHNRLCSATWFESLIFDCLYVSLEFHSNLSREYCVITLKSLNVYLCLSNYMYIVISIDCNDSFVFTRFFTRTILDRFSAITPYKCSWWFSMVGCSNTFRIITGRHLLDTNFFVFHIHMRQRANYDMIFWNRSLWNSNCDRIFKWLDSGRTSATYDSELMFSCIVHLQKDTR